MFWFKKNKETLTHSDNETFVKSVDGKNEIKLDMQAPIDEGEKFTMKELFAMIMGALWAVFPWVIICIVAYTIIMFILSFIATH